MPVVLLRALLAACLLSCFIFGERFLLHGSWELVFLESDTCWQSATSAVTVRGDVGHAGKWTVQQAAELSVAAPTIEAALDGRFLSGLKDERLQAAKFYQSKHGLKEPEPLKVCKSCAMAA